MCNGRQTMGRCDERAVGKQRWTKRERMGTKACPAQAEREVKFGKRVPLGTQVDAVRAARSSQRLTRRRRPGR